jgi:hypothetical protein
MNHRFASFSFSLLALSTVVGCGSTTSGINDDRPRCLIPEGCGDSGRGVGSSGGPTPDAPATGPEITISLQGTTAPFTHADALSGATPNRQIVAVRSLYLFRSPTDPSPVEVFDLDTSAVEVELVSGQKTKVASVVAKTLPAGVFTMAKAGIAYVRYSVDARMHSIVAVDGQYENVQALSDGAVIDGVPRTKGHFSYSFVANGTTYGTLTGEDAPTPAIAASGGISLDTTGPQAFYVFPVQVALDPDVTVDREALLEVNVHESFRWQDQTAPGYTAKTFDTTPSSFEPVISFGANTFELTLAP